MIMELEARLKLSDDDVFYLRHNNITLTHEVERLRDENAALQRENAALRTVAMKLIVNNGGPLQSEEQAERDSVDDYIMIKLQDFEALCAAIDTARKEAKQ